MFSVLVGLLSLAIIIILFLTYHVISMFRRHSHLQEKLLFVEEQLSKEMDKKHKQNAELIELKNQVEINISKDFLTALTSRQIFEDRLIQILSQSKRHHLLFAVLFLNLDGFKIINDALGLDAGDQLLKEMAVRVQSCIRQLDTASRFGGDEFVLILPQLSKPEMAAYVAQRLLDAIAEPCQVSGQEVFVTASIGIAIYPNDGDEASTLLKNADNALHQAKARGRNHYQFYQKEMYVLSQRELVLSSSLHSPAIYQDFLIYYQPLINVKTKKIICMEAVLRWKHPDLGLIDLKDYLRLAENSGSIMQIGEWLLRHACQQFHTWKSLGFFIQNLAVSVSLHQLENPHFIYKVTQILQEFNLSPSCLILEISEVTLLSKVGISEKTLLMLKELGVQIGISDFGTGNMALRQLQSFPIDHLKIASSLIQDITINKEIASIVKMIIVLAKSLNLQVVATGVETQKQMQQLKLLGCNMMQGNVFSPPVLPQEFTMLVEKSILESV